MCFRASLGIPIPLSPMAILTPSFVVLGFNRDGRIFRAIFFGIVQEVRDNIGHMVLISFYQLLLALRCTCTLPLFPILWAQHAVLTVIPTHWCWFWSVSAEISFRSIWAICNTFSTCLSIRPFSSLMIARNFLTLVSLLMIIGLWMESVASEMVAMGVLNSWVMLLIKSFLISDVFFCWKMTYKVWRNKTKSTLWKK